VEINFNVRDFKIADAKIYGDFFGEENIKELEKALNGLEHSAEIIKKAFAEKNIDPGRYIKGCDSEKFAELII
jgi:lipoate-protein ligase A